MSELDPDGGEDKEFRGIISETQPLPIITSRETFEQGWDQWPSPATAVERWLRKVGFSDVRIGFSRGYKPAPGENKWTMVDSIGVWARGMALPPVAFFWDRLPEGANTWSTSSALVGRYATGHAKAKLLIKDGSLVVSSPDA